MVVRSNEESERVEQEAAAIVSSKWGVSLIKMPKFSGVDYFFYNGVDRRMGVFEVKRRYNDSTKYPTVYLSVRKYLALKGYYDEGLLAFFLPYFDDALMYIGFYDIDASKQNMLGRRDRSAAPNDIEPMIEVPVSSLRTF